MGEKGFPIFWNDKKLSKSLFLVVKCSTKMLNLKLKTNILENVGTQLKF